MRRLQNTKSLCAFLAAHDCHSREPVYTFRSGRWYVYHQQDEYLVMITKGAVIPNHAGTAGRKASNQ